MMTLERELSIPRFESLIKPFKWRKFSYYWVVENDSEASYCPAGGTCPLLSIQPKFRNFVISGFSDSFHINSSSTT